MATAEGTNRFLRLAVERGLLHSANVRHLGPGLSCSALGFGAYRVGGGDKAAEHRSALRAALRAGMNLIDTSSHYTAASTGSSAGHGASERLVGEAIAGIPREGVVLCTKVGHAARGTEPPPGATRVGALQGGGAGGDDWHSIDPGFIDAEVRASRERLGTAPDFVLLHNPEYFLTAQLQQRVPITDAWDEMYDRLQEAFKALEALCEEGVITSGYGVSSNFLSCLFSTTGRGNLYEALALDRVLDAAGAAVGQGREHRLRLVQLPLNAFESGAVLGRGAAVPEASEGDCSLASKLGVAVVANRPLNSLPMPGVSSGDWGRNGATHLRLREAKPMGTVESLLRRVLLEAIFGTRGVPVPSPPLQQLALRLALSAPSVACCLCGMRVERYVEDAIAVLGEQPFAQEQVLRAFRAVRTAAEELGCQHRGLW